MHETTLNASKVCPKPGWTKLLRLNSLVRIKTDDAHTRGDILPGNRYGEVMEVTLDSGRPPLAIYQDVKDGCGGMIWPAGTALIHYLLSLEKSMFRNKNIVELGSGTG